MEKTAPSNEDVENANPPPHTKSAIGSGKERHAFFSKAPLQTAGGLQNRLSISEGSYNHVVGYAHADARTYYLYGVLDEVIKASVATLRWCDLLGEIEAQESEASFKGDNIERLVIESILDEQEMWTRKLAEILADLILFSTTNDQRYYRLYLVCRQLDSYLGLQKDFKDFFSCQNSNAYETISDLYDQIDTVAKEIDIRNVWFLNSAVSRDKPPLPGRIFRSARERFKRALEVAPSYHRMALGISYETGHSVPSRAIHPDIGGPRRRGTDYDQLDRNIARVGMLAISISTDAYAVAGIEPEGTAKQLSQLLAGETVATEVMKGVYQRKLDVGDIVLAYGNDLCQVVDQAESKYGYTSYKVRYLTKPPLQRVVEDWFPAHYIHLVYPREKIRPAVIDFLKQDDRLSDDQLMTLRELSDQEWTAILADVFTKLEQAGVLPHGLANS